MFFGCKHVVKLAQGFDLPDFVQIDDGLDGQSLALVESLAGFVIAVEPMVKQLSRSFGRKWVIALITPAHDFIGDCFCQRKAR
jgi:hypothetical protein